MRAGYRVVIVNFLSISRYASFDRRSIRSSLIRSVSVFPFQKTRLIDFELDEWNMKMNMTMQMNTVMIIGEERMIMKTDAERHD